MKYLYILLLSCFSTTCIFAQPNGRPCGQQLYESHLYKQYPDFKKQRTVFHEKIKTYLSNNRPQDGVYMIPVVVHVVYANNGQNISEAQIESQFEVLNNDYRKRNSDYDQTPNEFLSLVSDVEVQFCLATKDPDGNSTNGITRTFTSDAPFGVQGDKIKKSYTGGTNAWDNKNYLNIWVCDLAGSTLGYATPPFGSAPDSTDGVVIDYQYFGAIGTATAPYDQGRTVTHEVGHYLNLHHIWGPTESCTSDDNIDDTPPQETAHYGCPSHPDASCSSNDMFMNFMDYVDDRCMFMFTQGQRAMMRAVLESYRSELIDSDDLVDCVPFPPTQSCLDLSRVDIQMGFEPQDNIATWTTENTNNDVSTLLPDGHTWAIYYGVATDSSIGPRTGEYFIGYQYNSSNTTIGGNDWLFAPCTGLEANVNYEITYAYTAASGYPEKMKVALASTPNSDSIVSVLRDLGTITNNYPNYIEVRDTFMVNKDGNYAIGFHVYSDPDQLFLALDDINISKVGGVVEPPPIDSTIYTTVEVFPNPVYDNFTVKIDSPDSIRTVNIAIYDVLGRLITQEEHKNVKNQSFPFGLNGRQTGMYFIVTDVVTKIVTKKILVAGRP